MSYGKYESLKFGHISILISMLILLFIVNILLLWYAFLFNDFNVFIKIFNFIKNNYKIILLFLPIMLFMFFTMEI